MLESGCRQEMTSKPFGSNVKAGEGSGRVGFDAESRRYDGLGMESGKGQGSGGVIPGRGSGFLKGVIIISPSYFDHFNNQSKYEFLNISVLIKFINPSGRINLMKSLILKKVNSFV